jgi:ABC-type amino acid transport substrate-binding protein
MVTEAGFAPYEYYDGGEVVGVDVDIAKEIAKYLGKTLVVKDIAFDSIINEVKTGKADFGGTAFCESKTVAAGGYIGFKDLLTEILTFFKTKKVPVTEQETIEIFTFMEASNQSKRLGGKPVSMQETLERCTKAAQKVLKAKKY